MAEGLDVPLSSREKADIVRWKRVAEFATPRDKEQLPGSLFGLYIGRQAVRLVRHPLFGEALERAEANAETARKARLEAERVAAVERANRRFFEFWYYRGTAYGASKYKKEYGDKIYTVTEFFLKRDGMADSQIVLTGYDLPIANGQHIAVVYGCLKGVGSGDAILYCNYTINVVTRLSENFKKLEHSRPYVPNAGIPMQGELDEFRKKCKL